MTKSEILEKVILVFSYSNNHILDVNITLDSDIVDCVEELL